MANESSNSNNENAAAVHNNILYHLNKCSMSLWFFLCLAVFGAIVFRIVNRLLDAAFAWIDGSIDDWVILITSALIMAVYLYSQGRLEKK